MGKTIEHQIAKPVGLTSDVGWEIGLRRTLPIHPDEAWNLMTSPQGVDIWLGQGVKLRFEKGAHYELDDGTSGEVRVFTPYSHLRLTWQPPGWERASLIQVRVMPSGEKSVISFHQEHLPGQAEREARRRYYMAVMDQLEALIKSGG